MLFGLHLFLGTALNPKVARVVQSIIPQISLLFGQGATIAALQNVYPGAMGTVLSSLYVNLFDGGKVALYIMCFALNLLLAIGFYTYFYISYGNTNPFKQCLKKRRKYSSVQDIEMAPVTGDKSYLLQGENLVKEYALGESSGDTFRALNDISFGVRPGQLLGLVVRPSLNLFLPYESNCGQ